MQGWRGGWKDTDNGSRGIGEKRCGLRTRGCISRRRHHLGRNLRGYECSRSRSPPLAGKMKRERVSVRWENPAGDSSVVGES